MRRSVASRRLSRASSAIHTNGRSSRSAHSHSRLDLPYPGGATMTASGASSASIRRSTSSGRRTSPRLKPGTPTCASTGPAGSVRPPPDAGRCLGRAAGRAGVIGCSLARRGSSAPNLSRMRAAQTSRRASHVLGSGHHPPPGADRASELHASGDFTLSAQTRATSPARGDGPVCGGAVGLHRSPPFPQPFEVTGALCSCQ